MGLPSVEVLAADITTLPVDAISNAANTRLEHGGGVAAAIVRAGGAEIQLESDALAPIALGEAVFTAAGRLPSRWVIHPATMQLGGRTSAQTISQATTNTLLCSEHLGARSLALVAFGTGVGGFPLEQAAEIQARALELHLKAKTTLERVVFCLREQPACKVYEAALAKAHLKPALG